MRAPLWRLVLTLVLVASGLAAGHAIAQTTGDIEGIVSDSSGAPLPGATVTLSSPSLQGSRTSVSDGAGRFRFPALSPGTYLVTASLAGFAKVERSGQQVMLGGTTKVPIAMSVSLKEEVVVMGEAPVIDTAHGGLGASTSVETIRKLPLARNFVSIAQTLPGTGTSVGGGTSVYGATGLENQYIIDGVNTTGVKIGDQGKFLNQEFVQEVEVKTGGYEAEYSRALGGVINVVTKSGGNEFHGDAFGYYDGKGVSASDKRVADEAAIGLAEGNLPQRFDFGADLGGYFLKDRVWFFGAFNRVSSNTDVNVRTGYSWTNPVVTTTPITNGDRSNIYSGKLTFRLGEAHTLTAAVFGDPESVTGRQFDIIGPLTAQTGVTEYGGADVSVKYDGLFGPHFLVQAQYGHHEDKSDTTPDASGLAVRSRRSGFLTFYNAGSGDPFWTTEEYKRDAGKLAFTTFFGGHEIKAGVDYEGMKSNFMEQYGGGALVQDFYSRASGGYLFSYNVYFARVPLNCIAAYDADGNVVKGNFGVPGKANAAVPNTQSCLGYTPLDSLTNNPKTENLGFFVQDSWKILKNLTLNAGVRYDNQKLKNASGETAIDLGGEWSPRVGLVWDFLNNGKSKLYASYGRYYTTIPQDIQTRALGNEYGTFAYNYSQGTRDPVADPSVASYAYIQGGQITQDGLRGMYQDELVGGIEYEVFRNWSVGVKGIYKAIGRIVEDRCDLADPVSGLSGYIPSGALTTCALTNMDGSSQLASMKDPTNPQCVAADGTLTAPCEPTNIRRYYRGVELSAAHRFSNNFYLLASYVYSQLKGNYDGNEKQSTGQQDPNINADFDYYNLVPNNFGLLALNHTHQFKVSAAYTAPFGVTAGANFHYASGAPLAVRGFARPGYTSERYLTADRGFLEDLPGVYEMDLHLEYALRLGGVSITPIVDIFNLFNRQGVTSIDGRFNTLDAASNDPKHQIGQPGCTAANATYENAACATNQNYLKANAWQTPTRVRIGARVTF
jgi:outer membrane receptor protein involved in Fe transport